jgi:hypothetical protein
MWFLTSPLVRSSALFHDNAFVPCLPSILISFTLSAPQRREHPTRVLDRPHDAHAAQSPKRHTPPVPTTTFSMFIPGPVMPPARATACVRAPVAGQTPRRE